MENLAEDLSFYKGLGGLAQLYTWLNQLNNQAHHYGVVVFCGDNGVSYENISNYEPMSSGTIVNNHLWGLSPTALFLKKIGKPEFVVDVGLYTEYNVPGLLRFNVKRGSANFLQDDALDKIEVEQAINVGQAVWNEIQGDHFDIIGIGEIGIGDTLCAAAIATVMTGAAPEDLTGPGSASNKVIGKKNDIISRALDNRYPDRNNVIDILSRFGGLEIAALTGFIAEAAARHVPVMLDGFVTAVAALLAGSIDSRVNDLIFASNLSCEPGHLIILNKLGLKPVFDMNLNYGEGLASALGLFLAETAVEVCGAKCGKF